MANEYAQQCNWCEWKDMRELVDSCPECGKVNYLMDSLAEG